MNADSDIQVWMERLGQAQPAVMVPYVQSTKSRNLRYKLRAVKTGREGRSMIGQGGSVHVLAGQPVPLGRMSIRYGPQDECTIDVVLYEQGQETQYFDFSCPEKGVSGSTD